MLALVRKGRYTGLLRRLGISFELGDLLRFGCWSVHFGFLSNLSMLMDDDSRLSPSTCYLLPESLKSLCNV